jgi:hypothetical protein
MAVAFAVLFRRGREGLRERLFSWGGFGLLCLAAAGLVLAAGGGYKLLRFIRHGNEPVAAWEEYLAKLQDPPETLRVRIVGADPFQASDDAWLLRLTATPVYGEWISFTSDIPASRMQAQAGDGSAEEFREYVIPWSVVVEHAQPSTPQAQAFARSLSRIEYLRSLTIQPAIVHQGTEAVATPDSLRLVIREDPLVVLFAGDKASDEAAADSGEWVAAYSGGASWDQQEWPYMRTQDDYNFSLAWLHPATVILLACGVTLLFLGVGDGSRAGNKPETASSPNANGTIPPTASFRWSRTLNRVLILAGLVIGLSGVSFSEKIPVARGFGWDGESYGLLAQNFYHRYADIGLNAYQAQRLLPSAIVHYTLRFLSIPRTPLNVVYAFGLLTSLVLGLAAWMWCRIADNLKFSDWGKLLGFAALFLNFFILKWAAYYPVLTDYLGYLIALAMVYSYLTGARWALCLLIAVGAFVWPALIFQGALLLFFPKETHNRSAYRPAPYHLNGVLAVVVAWCTFAWTVYIVISYDGIPELFSSGYLFYGGRAEPGVLTRFQSQIQSVGLTLGEDKLWMVELLGINAVVVALYLVLGLRTLWNWDALYSVPYVLRRLVAPSFLFGAAFVVAVKFLVGRCAASPAPFEYSTIGMLRQILGESVRWPGAFGVALVAFFGPLLLCLVFRWSAVCRLLHWHGLGATAAISLGFWMSIEGEVRHVLTFYALLVPFVVKTLEGLRWDRLRYLFFVVLALAFSKVWLIFPITPDDFGSEQEKFPVQYFYMSFSCWMSWRMYLVQGALTLAAACLCGLLLIRNLKKPTAPSTNPEAAPIKAKLQPTGSKS